MIARGLPVQTLSQKKPCEMSRYIPAYSPAPKTAAARIHFMMIPQNHHVTIHPRRD